MCIVFQQRTYGGIRVFASLVYHRVFSVVAFQSSFGGSVFWIVFNRILTP